MGWTDERVELLSKLWSEGLSASQIATQLGGVTRNAVIGKVHRLKLEGRARPAAGAVLGAGESINTVIVEEAEEAVEVAAVPISLRLVAGQPAGGRLAPRMEGATALRAEPEGELVIGETERVPGEVVPMTRNLTLVQLSDRTCKWPLGDPLSADFRFCGNSSNDASPYCVYHARLAFQPVSERRRVR